MTQRSEVPRGRPSSFVALVVGDAPWRRALLEGRPPRVRALHPDDVHVTLAFLGGVSPERARAAFDAAAALPLRAMEARLGAIEPRGHEARWTALSVLLEDAHAVADAMTRVRDVASAAAEIAPEHRAPLPHVTIARLHAKASPTERAAALAWAQRTRGDRAHTETRLRLDRLALYTGRAVKEAGAPAYDVIAERRLP
ncbi:MAG: hypothetical protein K1X94_29780 [Sandaracinaceae bacterium]|nr:hypothetical protein [Sandaracinaceae bacterium]